MNNDIELMKETTMVKARNGHGNINVTLEYLIQVSLRAYGGVRRSQPLKVLEMPDLGQNVLVFYNRIDDTFEHIGMSDADRLDKCNSCCYFVDLVPSDRINDYDQMEKLGATLLTFDDGVIEPEVSKITEKITVEFKDVKDGGEFYDEEYNKPLVKLQDGIAQFNAVSKDFGSGLNYAHSDQVQVVQEIIRPSSWDDSPEE